MPRTTNRPGNQTSSPVFRKPCSSKMRPAWLNLMRLVMISGAENRKPNLNQWHPYRWEVVDLSRWHISQSIVCVFSSHTILPRTAKAISTPRASHIVCKIDRVIRVAARGHQCPCVVSISTRIPPRCPDSFVATLPRSWIAARLWSALSKCCAQSNPSRLSSKLTREPAMAGRRREAFTSSDFARARPHHSRRRPLDDETSGLGRAV